MRAEMGYLKPRLSRNFLLNFGPQHPAAHGILKLSLVLEGELLRRADPQFGLLHRGTEKLCEGRHLAQILPYADRMDYVANLFQEHTVVSAVESSSLSKPNLGIRRQRLALDELSRVLNHLLTLSAVCLDLGSMGPIFWAFEEREQIMELFERASGARMHTAIYAPYRSLPDTLTKELWSGLLILARGASRLLSGAFLGLLNNKTLRGRLVGLGQLTPTKVEAYGITGILARSSGVLSDLRGGWGGPSYGAYGSTSLTTYLGRRGDNYDRFILRAREIIESWRLILQVGISSTGGGSSYSSMEGVINHFCDQGQSGVAGLGRGYVEGPKGAVGCLLLSSNGGGTHRLQFRSPVAHNMHLIPSMARGSIFGDFVATFCSLDVVLGEIDR